MSYGRDARSGSSLRVDIAFIDANAAIGSAQRIASVPPQTTTSARPSRIMSRPIEMPSAPDAQALTGVCTPARAEISRPIAAAGPFGISIGMQSGDTNRAPFAVQGVVRGEQRRHAADAGRHRDAEALRVDADRVPARVLPGLAGRDDGVLAAAVEAPRLDAGEDLERLDRDRRTDVHRQLLDPVLGQPRTPDRPASIDDHIVATSPPRGVVAPRPVTTTVRLLMGGTPPW